MSVIASPAGSPSGSPAQSVVSRFNFPVGGIFPYLDVDLKDGIPSGWTYTQTSASVVGPNPSGLYVQTLAGEFGIVGGLRVDHSDAVDYGYGANGIEYTFSGVSDSDIKGLRFMAADVTRANSYGRGTNMPAQWGTSNATATADQDGLDGVSNAAATVADSGGAALGHVNLTEAIPDDSNKVTIRTFYKKTTSAATFPGLSLELRLGSTTVTKQLTVDTDNGTVTARSSNGSDVHHINDAGNWWEVALEAANNSTGNTEARIRIYPAVNTDASGTWVSAQTGSCIVDAGEIFENTQIENVNDIPPFLTDGSAVTRTAPRLKFNDPTEYTDDAGMVYAEFEVNATPTSNAKIVGSSISSQSLIYTGSAGTTEVLSRDSADIVSGGNITFGVRAKVAVRWTSTIHQIARDGVVSAEEGRAGTYPSGEVGIGYRTAVSHRSTLTFRRLKMYAVDGGESFIEDLTT